MPPKKELVGGIFCAENCDQLEVMHNADSGLNAVLL